MGKQDLSASGREDRKPKIFAFNNGGSDGFLHGLAIAEDGHVLAGHCSSDEGWMRHDLGVNSDWQHEKYSAHYPNGWEIEWVASDAIEAHVGLKAAFDKNFALTVSFSEPTSPPPSPQEGGQGG